MFPLLLWKGLTSLVISTEVPCNPPISATSSSSASSIPKQTPHSERNEPSQAPPTAKPDPNQPPTAVFILCSVDGTIYSLDSWSGRFLASSRTGPLLTRSASNEDAASNAVIPGLDGKLYWQPNGGGSDDDDDDENSNNNNLQPLPISIPSLLEHPVRSCSEDGEECGILTAVAHTTLLALDTESGAVRWTTNTGTKQDDDPNESNTQTTPTVLLQRKDFAIQQYSTASGEELWNVTMGSYQAMDFGAVPRNSRSKTRSIDDDDDLSDDFLDEEDENEHNDPMPSLVFGNGGRELAAVQIGAHGEHTILWRIESPHILTSVFAIHQKRWKSVKVLDEDNLKWNPRAHHAHGIKQNLQLPAHAAPQPADYSHLWNQRGLHQRHGWDESFWRTDAPQQQRLLPSHVSQATCSAGDIQCLSDGLTSDPIILQLPGSAPPSIDLGDRGRNELVYYALLLWSLCLLTALAVIGLRVTKNKSLSSTERARPDLSSTEDTTKDPIKESVSFPGAIRHHQHLKMDLQKETSNEQQPVQSDPGEVGVFENEADSDNQQKSTPIPLVQYSRYSSEFDELEALGRGGFGSVFRCRNKLDGRDYAIKKVTIREVDESTFQQELQRVLREVKILAVLEHEHIVRYFTCWLETCHDDAKDNRNSSRNKAESSTNSQVQSYNVHDYSEGESSSFWNDSASSIQDKSSSTWNFQSRGSKFSNPHSWRNQQKYLQRNVTQEVDDDCGIIFEDSAVDNLDNTQNQLSMRISDSTDGFSDGKTRSRVHFDDQALSETRKKEDGSELSETTKRQPVKHTLYIQMELCPTTVGDFLLDKDTRESSGKVEIPIALSLIFQIAKAVQHVHEQGLIHRDLKPSNCFMDKSGVVKVGDFGLSRETSGEMQPEEAIVAPLLGEGDEFVTDDDHTAGVGTRLYASPEQIDGSSYDASTDVFSLGIIFFELAYPMYTGMERNICLSKLRQCREFPQDWNEVVGTHANQIRQLLAEMLEPKPFARPTAKGVAQQLQGLMGEDQEHIVRYFPKSQDSQL